MATVLKTDRPGDRAAGERAEVDRHAPAAPRRRRQGDRARPLRRRHLAARHAGRQGAAQPAAPRPPQVDRHRQGRGAAGGQGGDHPRRLPGSALGVRAGRRDAGQLPRHGAQRPGAREGAVRRPRGRGGGGDQREDRQGSAQADRGRVRAAAARDRRGRGDGRRRAAAARGHVHRRRRAGARRSPRTSSKRVEFALGDTAAGFAQADIIVERTFDTKPVHQGYIEPHACIASFSEDGQAELWCSTQGHFIVRGHCAKMLGMDIGKLRVSASEIGGGFGGKTVVYLEPLALALSRKAHHPVKMVMTPRGGVPRHRPDLRRQRLGQGRGHQGRPDHRRRGGAQVPGGRVPGRAGAAGRDERVRALRPRARQGGRLRRGDQPAEGRGVSRARRADLRVRGRVRDGRAGQEARHGPGRVSPEERGQGGHARRLRARSSARSA